MTAKTERIQNSDETCTESYTKRLDGVYIIVAKIADLVLLISLQISNDVHFFSFLSHSTSRKESFELLWTKIAIGEQRHIQHSNSA